MFKPNAEIEIPDSVSRILQRYDITSIPLLNPPFMQNLHGSSTKSSGLASFVLLFSSQICLPMIKLQLWHLTFWLHKLSQLVGESTVIVLKVCPLRNMPLIAYSPRQTSLVVSIWIALEIKKLADNQNNSIILLMWTYRTC